MQAHQLQGELERQQVLALQVQVRRRARCARAAGERCSDERTARGRGSDPAAVGEEPLERVDQAARCAGGRTRSASPRTGGNGREAPRRARGAPDTDKHRAARRRQRRPQPPAIYRFGQHLRPRASASGRLSHRGRPRSGRRPVPLRGPAARMRPAPARPHHHCRSPASASARSRSGRESRNAREPSRRSCVSSRQRPMPTRRGPPRRSGRPLNVHEEVRLTQVAPSLTRLCLRSFHRACRERVEHVLDQVLRGQALDQLGLLQSNGGLVGHGGEQLRVLRAELPVLGEAADDAQLFIAGDEWGEQQRVLVDVGPEGSRRSATPCRGRGRLRAASGRAPGWSPPGGDSVSAARLGSEPREHQLVSLGVKAIDLALAGASSSRAPRVTVSLSPLSG